MCMYTYVFETRKAWDGWFWNNNKFGCKGRNVQAFNGYSCKNFTQYFSKSFASEGWGLEGSTQPPPQSNFLSCFFSFEEVDLVDSHLAEFTSYIVLAPYRRKMPLWGKGGGGYWFNWPLIEEKIKQIYIGFHIKPIVMNECMTRPPSPGPRSSNLARPIFLLSLLYFRRVKCLFKVLTFFFL